MKVKRHEPSETVENTTETAAATRAWRKALGTLGGPLLRLHHYRDVRTKALHEAMFMSDRQSCNVNSVDCESAKR